MSIRGHVKPRIDRTTSAFLASLAVIATLAGAKFDEAWLKATAIVEALVPSLSDETAELRGLSRAAQVGTIIAGVVIGASLLIGFFVIASIDDALPVITDAQLSNDKNSTVDRIGDGMLIGGVVIIVLFSAVILRVLRGLQ